MPSSSSAGKEEGVADREANGNQCEGVEVRKWDREDGGDRKEATALAGKV